MFGTLPLQSRMINHSCDPNCFSLIVHVDLADPLSNRILIIAKRAIEPGEELSYNYYTSPGEEGATPMACKCGADNCRGWL